MCGSCGTDYCHPGNATWAADRATVSLKNAAPGARLRRAAPFPQGVLILQAMDPIPKHFWSIPVGRWRLQFNPTSLSWDVGESALDG